MDSNEKKKHTKTKVIVSVIIIIIIILLLLTSCTSNFWGKIGNIFGGSSNYHVDDNSSQKEIINNQELVFETKEGTFDIQDGTYRIGYIVSKIKAGTITCTTSDASIATCVVYDDYVEVLPKMDGNVVINIETEANGKIYKANHNLNIIKSVKSLGLSKTSIKMYLSESNKYNVAYYLNNISGNVLVKISDEDIVDASANKGKLSITAK